MRMMLTIWVACIAAGGCKTPTFSFEENAPHTKDLMEIEIDSTYELYLRCVCRNTDNYPVNCFKNPKDTVEIGYIILSKEHEKVFVINNVANRNQKFFKKEKIAKRMLDTTELNVFYFKQFRYGTVDGNANTLQLMFDTAEKHRRTFIWNCRPSGDTLEISSVATLLPDGQNVRFSESSLYLIPTFVRSDPFKFIFQMPDDPEKPIRAISPSCKIFVKRMSRKNYVTYFEFKEPVHENHRAIKFGKKRMYAFPDTTIRTPQGR